MAVVTPSVVILALLLAMQAALASASPDAAGACAAGVHRYLERRPAVRATERQIIALLNAKEYRRAIPALKSAVTRYADPWAGDTLGDLYAAGLGVGRSTSAAAHWYLWSAERGDPFAQWRLADSYLNGVGVRRDTARAAYWFRIGIAPYELARSDYWLAGTFASGNLAPVNRVKQTFYLNESLRILRRLSREPSGEADFDLGRAYAGGYGVARDRQQALSYFCRALALGYEPAVAQIRKLQGRHR